VRICFSCEKNFGSKKRFVQHLVTCNSSVADEITGLQLIHRLREQHICNISQSLSSIQLERVQYLSLLQTPTEMAGTPCRDEAHNYGEGLLYEPVTPALPDLQSLDSLVADDQGEAIPEPPCKRVCTEPPKEDVMSKRLANMEANMARLEGQVSGLAGELRQTSNLVLMSQENVLQYIRTTTALLQREILKISSQQQPKSLLTPGVVAALNTLASEAQSALQS
jgi:hypothetical protein